MPTINILGCPGEKSKLVMHNPASAARSRVPPALRGLAFSTGLRSLTILNLKYDRHLYAIDINKIVSNYIAKKEREREREKE